ncbi:MAG: Ig-like domain-containing protein [Myxococcota bacterium]
MITVAFVRPCSALAACCVLAAGCFNPPPHVEGESEGTGGSGGADEPSSSAVADGESGDPDVMTGSMSMGEQDDQDAPYVVSLSPETDEAGVLADTPIVIVFSEPMNREATEAAWVSATVGAVDFSWNDAGDELTVTPRDPLEYAMVANDGEPALTYDWTLSAAATDEAGNLLEEAVVTSFTTLRAQSIFAEPVRKLSGSVVGDQWTELYSPSIGLMVGDDEANQFTRGLLTFPMEFPGNTTTILEAELDASHFTAEGTPYDDLGGSIRLHAVEFDIFDIAAADASMRSDVGPLAANAEQLMVEVDVSDAVRDSFAEALPTTQFRAQFTAETDGANDIDRQQLQGISLSVLVGYP